jgi:hypothetical protein
MQGISHWVRSQEIGGQFLVAGLVVDRLRYIIGRLPNPMSEQLENVLTFGGMFLLVFALGVFIFVTTSKRAKDWDRKISDRAMNFTAAWLAKFLSVIGWLIVAVAVAVAFALALYLPVWLFPDKEWAIKWRYSLEKDLNNAELSIQQRPHDCEFLTAPMGSKNCYYKMNVATTRVRLNATTGKQELSYDEGRTWSQPDLKYWPAGWQFRPQITVSWDRVEE